MGRLAVKQRLLLLLSGLLLLLPGVPQALTDSEIQDRKQISQVWVDRHNAGLSADTQGFIKQIRFKKHHFFVPTWHKHTVRLRRLRLDMASQWGVPLETQSRDGATVPLVALYVSQAGVEKFLTADYADELDKLHCSSDIYIKVGLEYKHLLHGEGYPGSARLITLGKTSPFFFEVGVFGGGTRVDKTIYRLDTDALKQKNDQLYNRPEVIDVEQYVKEELKLNVWLEGYTLYQDLGKDGDVEIVNSTDVLYPSDLKTWVEKQYNMVDDDFGTAFRQTVSIYRWDDTKAQFEDLGDYYY
jgi:hypothetical protein